jgi:hypothetical protein
LRPLMALLTSINGPIHGILTSINGSVNGITNVHKWGADAHELETIFIPSPEAVHAEIALDSIYGGSVRSGWKQHVSTVPDRHVLRLDLRSDPLHCPVDGTGQRMLLVSLVKFGGDAEVGVHPKTLNPNP